MRRKYLLYIICYILSTSLYAAPHSKDSAKIESIQEKMAECMTTLEKWAGDNSDAHFKTMIKTAKRLDVLAKSYYSVTKDSTVFAYSFTGELITAWIYNSHKMIDSAYIHSLKAYELYEPYGRMVCSSDTTGLMEIYIFGNYGLYDIMRAWYVKQMRFSDAIRCCTVIVDSCRARNANIEVVKSLIKQGEIYETIGDYRKSVESQIQALDTRVQCPNYGESPLTTQILEGILNTIEKLEEREKLLVNKESVEALSSDSDLISCLSNFMNSHLLDICEGEEKNGKTLGVKQLYYTFIRLGEKKKQYDKILSFEEGFGDFIVRNYGKESLEFAEYLMKYSNLYNSYLNELDSDIEKERYRNNADKKRRQAFEIWKNHFEQNPIDVYASNYQKLEKVFASQNLKKEETSEELARLNGILFSFMNYMLQVYSFSIQLGKYDAAYDAVLKIINIEEKVLNEVSSASYYLLESVSILRNDFENAEKYFDRSYSLAYEKSDTLNMAEAKLELFYLYKYQFNNQAKARKHLSDAYKLLKEYSFHSIKKAEILEEMADFYKSIHNDVIAYELFGLSQLEKRYCGQTLTDEDYLKEANYLAGELLLNDSVLFRHIKEIADKDMVSKQVQKASELLGLSYATSLTDFEKGIHYYQKAANIAHEIKDTISEVKDIAEIGTIFFAQKKYDKAFTYMQKAEKLNPRPKYEQLLPLLAHILNDSIVKTRLPSLYENTTKQLKKQLLSTNSEGREILVRLMPYDVLKSMIYYYPNLPVCADIAYNSTLLYKGLLQNTQKTVSEFIENSSDNNLKKQYEKLQIIRGKEGLQESTLELSTQSQIEKSELELSILENLSKKKVLADLEITWNDVRKKLGKNDVAIEFVEINKLESFDRSAFCYGALILRNDYKHPVFVELDSKETIDNNIDSLLHSVNFGSRLTVSRWNTASERLYKLIWGKLTDYIHLEDNVYFSADGLMHKTPIELLSDGLGNYANEKYNIFRLSSTRELCKKRKEGITSVVLYGGLLYDAEPKGQETDSLNAFQRFEDSSTRSGWNFLPASEAEIDSISSLLALQGINVMKKKGLDGTEESFKELSGMDLSVVHIATHGFYFPQKEAHYLGYFHSQADISPMKRSGLMMTGGQIAWMGSNNIEQDGDGILTSEEIATIDLSNVSMVVLSACQTGLGDIDTGAEGVIGIQRAFKLAGVQSLLMSLWKVDDNATSYMMQTFYSRMLSGETKHNAFKAAQQEVRKKYPNPYYWAGFVMLD